MTVPLQVTGHVLLTLDKNDLREMHIHAVGDRVYIDRSLIDLKKHARKIERERTLWEGELPAGPLQYVAYAGLDVGLLSLGCAVTVL